MASGMRKMKNAFIFEIRKRLVAKRAGRGCVRPKVCGRFLQLFCRHAGIPLPGFYKML